MNLIERLGGYQAAKDKYSKRPFDLAWSDIKDALLEYRIEHNIFELGDLVVFKKEYSKSSVIHKIDSLNAGTKCLRHATDKEIEQGCRDD